MTNVRNTTFRKHDGDWNFVSGGNCRDRRGPAKISWVIHEDSSEIDFWDCLAACFSRHWDRPGKCLVLVKPPPGLVDF